MPKSASSPERDPNLIPMRRPPARTRERRVQQLVVLAEGLIEERLMNGTASPTETVAIVRLGTEIERANIERVKMHTEYLKAQKAKAESETVREEMFTNAVAAMSRYRPTEDDDVDV
jgi:hypothetical protein